MHVGARDQTRTERAPQRRDAATDGAVGRAEMLAVAATTVAFVIAAIAVMRMRWVPIGDNAMIEMRVRDVPADLPLVGVYSRFGWSHPGPLQLWLLAIPHRVLGTSNSLLVGTLAVHLSAVLAAWWMARRIARVAGWTVLIALMAVMAAVPAQLGHSPWNPFVSMVGAGAVIVAAWATAERSPWAPVVLVAFGSLLVQAHAGTAPLVGAVSVAALCLAAWSARADQEPVLSRRTLAVSCAVGVALWIGPLLDRFFAAEPNASLLAMGGSGDRVGAAHSLSSLTRAFALWPSWLEPDGPGHPVVGTSWALPVWLALPVGGAVVAVLRRDRPFIRGSIVVAASLVATAVAGAMIRGEFYGYLAVAQRPVAAIAMAVGAAALARRPIRAPEWAEPVPRLASVAAATVVVVLAATMCVRHAVGEDGRWESEPALAPLADRLADQLRPGETIVFDVPDSGTIGAFLNPGLMLQLELRGFEVRQLDANPRTVGARRVTDQPGDAQVVVLDEDQVAAFESAGWRIIGPVDGETPIWVALDEAPSADG